jgi:hypothetical protein
MGFVSIFFFGCFKASFETALSRPKTCSVLSSFSEEEITTEEELFSS